MKKILTVSIQTIITFAFCFIVLCPNPALAQTQEENRKGVLPIQMIDTRSQSMAGTTIADVYGRPSIGINPALSGLFDKHSFIQFNTNYNWDTNLMIHDLSLATMYSGPHHITARFGLLHGAPDKLPFTKPSSIPDPDIIMYRGELAYAYAFSNYFSLGALQSISLTSNKDSQNWNYYTDLGLVYAPDGTVSYGMVFRGLGHETAYEIIESGETILSRRNARKILEIGITLQYPIQERTYLSISFANEKRFGEDGLWYKGGFEIIPLSFIDIRAGAMVNFEQSLFMPRFGLGINTNVIRFDYMIAPGKVNGEQFHQLGLTLQF